MNLFLPISTAYNSRRLENTQDFSLAILYYNGDEKICRIILVKIFETTKYNII